MVWGGGVVDDVGVCVDIGNVVMYDSDGVGVSVVLLLFCGWCCRYDYSCYYVYC